MNAHVVFVADVREEGGLRVLVHELLPHGHVDNTAVELENSVPPLPRHHLQQEQDCGENAPILKPSSSLSR